MSKLRIFLADDHQLVREGFKALLNAQPDMEVVGEAGDGAAAVQQATATQPDVALLDISMPQFGGAQVTRQLKPACPQTKFLVLTVHEDRTYLREMLDAGAHGYLLKRAAADDLVRAIHTVAAGEPYLDPKMAARALTTLPNPHASPKQAARGELSEREATVLRFIAQGFSNKEIAAQLNLSVKTIETYKMRSMDKLDLRSRVDIVRYASQRGWLASP